MKSEKSRKNVALITGALYIGGAEKVAALLSQYLAQNGYNVYWFLDHYDSYSTYAHDGKVIRMSTMNTGNVWIDMYYKAKFLKEQKKKFHIQYSISFMEDYNFINVLSRADDKVIVSVHTFLSGRKKEWKDKIKRYEFLIPVLYNRADKVTTLTEIGRKDLRKNFGVKKNAIEVIPNLIDEAKLSALCSERKLPEKSIVMIGRHEEVKAQWHMIRAMKEVVRKNETAHLYLFGKGTILGHLKKIAEHLGLEKHVHFEGFQPNVYEYLQSAHLFVHSSVFEGFGNAILDALVCGIPVICTDCKVGPRDILAPGTSYPDELKKAEYAEYGILVPCPDSNKDNISLELTESEKCMADTVDKLLNDEKLWNHYADQSRKRAEYYDTEKIGQKWVDLMEKLDRKKG